MRTSNPSTVICCNSGLKTKIKTYYKAASSKYIQYNISKIAKDQAYKVSFLKIYSFSNCQIYNIAVLINYSHHAAYYIPRTCLITGSFHILNTFTCKYTSTNILYPVSELFTNIIRFVFLYASLLSLSIVGFTSVAT